MELFDHQRKFLSANPDKSSLVWSCGTGKTRTAIEWSKDGDVLIICPKPLKTNWKREVEKWRKTRQGEVKIMTKEEFRASAKDIDCFDQVIVDEVHNGFLTPHFKSQMSKALKGYLKKHATKRVLLLSATVYTSSPWNIYNLAHYLGHNLDWAKFNYMFFDQIRMGNRVIPMPKKGCEEKLANITKKIASIVDINDCMDVPLQQHLDPEYFEMTVDQARAVRENYDPLPIVRYTAQHEIESGILLGNEFRMNQSFSCHKNDRLLALVAENDKIAVVCRYNYQIDVLAKLLAHYKPLIIRGDVKDRDSITLQAEKASKAVVLIQADCAEGYELPSFPLCIFMSQSYSYVKWEQICGRFLRMNKPSRTTFMYLLTEGDSIDQAVYDAVKKKEDFKINLYKK